MPILSKAEHAALKAYIAAHPGLSDNQIFDVIHEPSTVANPSPQGTVPTPLSMATVMACITVQASVANVEMFPAIADLVGDIIAQNHAKVGGAATLLLAAARITTPEFNAIEKLLTSTIPDPNWLATVPGPSWAETNLGTHGSKEWVLPDGSTRNFIPHLAIAEARS